MDNPPAIQAFHLPAFPPVLAIPSSHSDDVASSLRGTLATSSSDSFGVVVGILSGGKKVIVFQESWAKKGWYSIDGIECIGGSNCSFFFPVLALAFVDVVVVVVLVLVLVLVLVVAVAVAVAAAAAAAGVVVVVVVVFCCCWPRTRKCFVLDFFRIGYFDPKSQ